MRYLNLIGGLLLAGILTGCETTQMDRYLTPELGTAIGGLIGAKITGTTYNGPIPLPFPGQGSSGSPSQPGYGGAGTGYGGAGAAALPAGGMPNTPECRDYMNYAYTQVGPMSTYGPLMQKSQACANSGAVSQLPDGMPSTPECQDFWRYARSDSCSSDRVMLGIGTCDVSLVQQKAATCNASRARQSAPAQSSCPRGHYTNGQTCVAVPAGAEACAIGGYCPQGTRCKPNGGCDAITDSGKKLEDLLEELDKGTRSKEQLEVLERVNRDLNEHGASGQNAPTGQDRGTAGTQPPSGSSQTGLSAQKAPPQTPQDSAAGNPGASSEPFTGTMTHPVYKKTPVINDGQGTQTDSGGGAASPSKNGNTTSFVQDWLDGKPVDPVKLSPDARRTYYEQKAKEEAAARAEAARQNQAAERAYQTTFGRASRYNTTAEEVPTTPTRTTPAPAKAPAAEDDPSLLDRLSHTPMRVDSDRTQTGGQQQGEQPSYK